jgi:hypothetical protein
VEGKMAQIKRTTTKKQAVGKSKKVTKGDSFVCEVCGLAVTVDESCGCVETCDIICCGQPMKARSKRVKVAK